MRRTTFHSRPAIAAARACVASLALAILLAACGQKAAAQPAAGQAKNPAQAAAGKALPAAELEALMASLSITAAPNRPEVPDIALVSLDGKKSKLSDYRGKALLLNFWATWCPPCRAEMPSMKRMRNILRKEGRAFEIVSIDVAEKGAAVRAFLKKNAYDFPVFLDESGAISGGFAGQGIPTSYVVDKAGRAAGFIIGSREWDEAGALELFRSLAAE